MIHSVTQPFCEGCVRARLSADGRLYTCLFAKRGHDLRALLRGGADDSQIASRIDEIWSARADRYSELRGLRESKLGDLGGNGAAASTQPDRRASGRIEMSYIGG